MQPHENITTTKYSIRIPRDIALPSFSHTLFCSEQCSCPVWFSLMKGLVP